MLTRRLFLGTTAGAAGLFGWLGRVRFRPQRRRLLGLSIMGDNALLVVSRVEDTFLATLTVGEVTVPLRIVAEDEDAVVFTKDADFLDRDLEVYVACRCLDADKFSVVGYVTTFERDWIGANPMIQYSSMPSPYDFGRSRPHPHQSVIPLYA